MKIVVTLTAKEIDTAIKNYVFSQFPGFSVDSVTPVPANFELSAVIYRAQPTYSGEKS